MDNFFTILQHRRSADGIGKTPAASSEQTTAQAKGASFAENAVQVNSARAGLAVAAFCRACEIRMNTMSMLQWQYQKLDKLGGNFTPWLQGSTQARRINYLLQVQPNPTMSASQMMRMAEYQIIFKGNAVIYPEKDEFGEVKAFWLATSATLDTQTMQYCLQYNSHHGVMQVDGIPAEDVIHIRAPFSNDNGLTGLPVLTYARQTLGIAATNDKFTLENAAKGGRVKLLVQEDKQSGMGVGRASKKELQKVTDQLGDDIYNKDVVLLNNIANVTPISMNAADMQLLQNRQFSVREVSRIMGVPPILLMDDSNSSYKSPEAATQEFLMRTIAPKINDWETEFNAKMVGPEGYGTLRFHLCDKPLTRLDPLGQATVNEKLLQTGVKTVNDLRKEYDMPSVEKGDINYISTNLAELGSKKLSDAPNGGRPTTEPEPKPNATEGEEGGEE